MGKQIVIVFNDAPYTADSFGLTMSGASASFVMNGPWDSSYLTPGATKESAAQGLYDYIESNLPVGTDITISKTTDTVYLFSESCNFVKFYKYTGSTLTLIDSGELYHNGTNLKFANVSSQDYSSNYPVGSNVINLTWSGASDPEESIKGYDLSYRIGSNSSWIAIPLILTNNGGASYNFVISQQITHEFRVRTVDTSNLVSAYKYFTQNIVPIFQISQLSAPGNACSLAEPNSPVYINTTNTTPSIGDTVFTDAMYTNTFNGTRTSILGSPGTVAQSWKVKTPSNVYYTFIIDGTGKITQITLCASSYNKGLLSIKRDVELDACLYNVLFDNNVYWNYNSTLMVGTSLYLDTSLTTSIPLGFYHISYLNPISNLSSDYIIKVGSGANSTGDILSIATFSVFCVPPTTNTTGGYGTYDIPIVIGGGYYNGSGNGGPKIICNLLYSQGFLSKEIWEADEKFGRLMLRKNKEVLFGYLTWAKPVVRFLTKNPQYSKYLYLISKPWNEHMAYTMGVLPKDNKIGKIIHYIGSKFSILIYKFITSKRRRRKK